MFNNAAQLWNHNFFWHCLAPNGGGKPEGELLKAIEKDFDGFDQFSEQFRTASVKQFGSGWGWLVKGCKTENCICEDCKCCDCCKQKTCCCGDACACCDGCKTGNCTCEDCKCCGCCKK